MSEKNCIVSHYLRPVFHPKSFAKIVDVLCTYLSKYDFDTVAFTGLSGAMVGPSVAACLNKYGLLVRKKDDNTHSSYNMEGNYEVVNYVIVDDIISSGNTIKYVFDKVQGLAKDAGRIEKRKPNLVGIVTYMDPNDDLYKEEACVHRLVKTLVLKDDFFLKSVYWQLKDSE